MIKISNERARGCGYRKPGGIYLVLDGAGSVACCKLPFELTYQHGVLQSRGFTWINSSIFLTQDCTKNKRSCPMNLLDEKSGCMWVGEKFYATPTDFSKEAHAMGISKRISQIPSDFEVGVTWIYLAHSKAIDKGEGNFAPGIFTAFKPDRIEYIVKGSETKKKIEELEAKGFTCVQVVKDYQMPFSNNPKLN